MKYVLFYDATPDVRSNVPAHLEAHRALWKTLFDDPFVSGGIVGRWTIREWKEVLGPERE